MTTSPTITGTIRLHVEVANPLESNEATELRSKIENFFESIRLSMFKGRLLTVHNVDQAKDGSLAARFDVEELEAGAFRVLLGMLSYYSMIVAPLSAMTARLESDEHASNLLSESAPIPALEAEPPFEVEISLRNGVAPPLVVEVEFGQALSDQDKDRLADDIMVWTAVVHGGYPIDDQGPGNSAIGPLTVRYDDRHTLHLSADAFMAHEECFAPLQALLLHWNTDIPVLRLETE